MKNYFFTFGRSHSTLDGVKLRFKWVRVQAKSYNKARRVFMDWCSENLGDPGKFAAQYREDDFEPGLYQGEYKFLT